jgi:hypothetical protein
VSANSLPPPILKDRIFICRHTAGGLPESCLGPIESGSGTRLSLNFPGEESEAIGYLDGLSTLPMGIV